MGGEGGADDFWHGAGAETGLALGRPHSGTSSRTQIRQRISTCLTLAKRSHEVLYAIAYSDLVRETEGADRVAGDLFRLARVKAGLTQAELADRAGVAQPLISAYERGQRQPTVPTLIRLLEAAGLELRMRLEPVDLQRRAANEWAAERPTEERERWAWEQREISTGRP